MYRPSAFLSLVNLGHTEIVIAGRNNAAGTDLCAKGNLMNLDLVFQPVELDVLSQNPRCDRIGLERDDIAATHAGKID